MSSFFCSAWEMSASGPSQSPDWLKQIQETASKDYQTLDIIILLIFLGTLSIYDHRPFTSPSNVFISASYSLYQSLRYPHFIFMFSCCASTLNQSRNSISVFSLLLHFLQKKKQRAKLRWKPSYSTWCFQSLTRYILPTLTATHWAVKLQTVESQHIFGWCWSTNEKKLSAFNLYIR